MRTAPGGSLESHGTTSNYELELVTSDDVNDMSIEQISLFESSTARTPLGDISCANDSLNAKELLTKRQVLEGSTHQRAWSGTYVSMLYTFPAFSPRRT